MDESPAQVEAEGTDTVTVTYGDETYTFPSSLDDADGDVIDAVDDGKMSHALRGLLSADDWGSFKKTKPKVRQYGELFEAYLAAIGLGTAGE